MSPLQYRMKLAEQARQYRERKKPPGWTDGRKSPRQTPEIKQRNEEIFLLRGQGKSLQEIGRKYGISKQRVHKIINCLTKGDKSCFQKLLYHQK